jgi:hypothetical protein
VLFCVVDNDPAGVAVEDDDEEEVGVTDWVD